MSLCAAALALGAVDHTGHMVSGLHGQLRPEPIPSTDRAVRTAAEASIIMHANVDKTAPTNVNKTTPAELRLLMSRPNVLFLVVDDLKPKIHGWTEGPHDNAKMSTPHLDQLMQDSLTLTNAHAQVAVCSPSRVSVLFGRRPDTMSIYDLETDPRDVGCVTCVTIPGLFKKAGYATIGLGKIFHSESTTGGNMDAQSWSKSSASDPALPPDARGYGAIEGSVYFKGHDGYEGGCQSDDTMHFDNSTWRVINESSTGLCVDSQVREHALSWLNLLTMRYIGDGQPFFLGVGFRRPHLPFNVPQEYYDLYPPDEVDLAPNPFTPADLPRIAYASFEIQDYNDIHSLNYNGTMEETLPEKKARELVRGYQAAVSYTDDNIGQLLEKLKRSPLVWQNTIVALWGDHGFKLGEHGAWTKHTVFEEDTLAPLILRVPGRTDGRALTSRALVEHIDIMATLVEAAGLPTVPPCPSGDASVRRGVRSCTEGHSFMPLIDEPDRIWKPAAFSQFLRDPSYKRLPAGQYIMGYSMRLPDARFTAWTLFNGTTNTTDWSMDNMHCAFELYNLTVDPLENVNLAHGDLQSLEYQLRFAPFFAQLKAGWQDANTLSGVDPTSGETGSMEYDRDDGDESGLRDDFREFKYSGEDPPNDGIDTPEDPIQFHISGWAFYSIIIGVSAFVVCMVCCIIAISDRLAKRY